MTDIEYPQCYIVRDITTEEAVWFIIIPDENDDLVIKPYLHQFLNKKYFLDVTTLSEAETYGAFGFAPVGSCVEFTKWLEDQTNEIAYTFGNIATATDTFGGDEYPSFWMVLENELKENKFTPVGLVSVHDQEDNPELPKNWWNKFNKHLQLISIESDEYYSMVAHREAPELNVDEIIQYVNEL